MSHEITDTDALLLRGAPAWHGLGVVVDRDLTATEAFTEVGLDWSVQSGPLYYDAPTVDGGSLRRMAEGVVANFRSDNQGFLGTVGPGYRPISNLEMASWIDALRDASEGVLKAETVGSIRGGRQVWALMRAGLDWLVGGRDRVAPYLAVTNGHDGRSSLQVSFTSVRVVCANTLRMVTDAGTARPAGQIAIWHCGDVDQKLGVAADAVRAFAKASDETRTLLDTLAGLPGSEALAAELAVALVRSELRDADADRASTAKRLDEMATAAVDRYRRELALGCDASLWLAVNAVTGAVQHDQRRFLAKDPAVRAERSQQSRLWGRAADRSDWVLRRAVADYVAAA